MQHILCYNNNRKRFFVQNYYQTSDLIYQSYITLLYNILAKSIQIYTYRSKSHQYYILSN